jgi:hypothetical protein
LPNIHYRVDARGDGLGHISPGVVQQNLVLADVDAERRKSREFPCSGEASGSVGSWWPR